MIDPNQALRALPDLLRDALLDEYRQIVQNFLERRWSPSELSGGRISEIIYCIVLGYGQGKYPTTLTKPTSMVDACKKLESVTTVPRSFQILIPRLLPALYEIRNNRGVGHVGGDVNPNHMDASAVLAVVNWIMSELVRVFHSSTTDEAQQLVDALSEYRIPMVWQSGDRKLVLDTKLSLKEQVLLLLASSTGEVAIDDVFAWTEYGNRAYFNRLIADLHKKRLAARSKDEARIQILPGGAAVVKELLDKRTSP